MKTICFEGVNGCGKEVQINLLQKYLERGGKKVSIIVENDLDPFREMTKTYMELAKKDKSLDFIRFLEEHGFDEEYLDEIKKVKDKFDKKNTDNIGFNMTLLLGLGRAFVQKNFIETSDEDFVLMDRWYYTNMVVQSENGLDPKTIKSINMTFGVMPPDIVFLIDLSAKEAQRRVQGRERSRTGLRDTFLDNLDKKRKAYLDMTEEENMIVVDGFGTREEVHEEIKKRLRQVL